MKVISKQKNTVLLEDGRGYRFYVPIEVYTQASELNDTEYLELLTKNSIPYSLSFDLIVRESIDEVSVETELYGLGIHTLEDVLKNRKLVNDVLKKHFSAESIIQLVSNLRQ